MDACAGGGTQGGGPSRIACECSARTGSVTFGPPARPCSLSKPSGGLQRTSCPSVKHGGWQSNKRNDAISVSMQYTTVLTDKERAAITPQHIKHTPQGGTGEKHELHTHTHGKRTTHRPVAIQYELEEKESFARWGRPRCGRKPPPPPPPKPTPAERGREGDGSRQLARTGRASASERREE